jgi:hypothetical protein
MPARACVWRAVHVGACVRVRTAWWLVGRRNDIDEEFRHVQARLKQSAGDLLAVELRSRFPFKTDALLRPMVAARMDDVEPLLEEEVHGIVTYMYNEGDAGDILRAIHDLRCGGASSCFPPLPPSLPSSSRFATSVCPPALCCTGGRTLSSRIRQTITALAPAWAVAAALALSVSHRAVAESTGPDGYGVLFYSQFIKVHGSVSALCVGPCVCSLPTVLGTPSRELLLLSLLLFVV